MTPLQRYDAQVRHILEWAIFIAAGLAAYRRKKMPPGSQ